VVEARLAKGSKSGYYAKVYLLPDANKSSKRKTHLVKNKQNPFFSDTFPYSILQRDLKDLTLDIALCKEGGSTMGRVQIPCSLVPLVNAESFYALDEECTWYPLAGDDASSLAATVRVQKPQLVSSPGSAPKDAAGFSYPGFGGSVYGGKYMLLCESVETADAWRATMRKTIDEWKAAQSSLH
jgi:hypothetical protein